MLRAPYEMTADVARALLGVSADVSAEGLTAAFRDAAKEAHPDVDGGDAVRFRQVVAAYRLLQRLPPPRPAIHFPPVPATPRAERLQISALTAMQGGSVETIAAGRKVRVHLPAGLREGDTVRVGAALLPVSLQGDFAALVRGHDLWLTIRLPAAVLADGGRVHVDTPLGRKTLWISRQAAERRLLRLPGQGLPARGPHPPGHLFLRLEADAAGKAESPARTLLRRFAAAWAA
jgi:curved DNA-binding protein